MLQPLVCPQVMELIFIYFLGRGNHVINQPVTMKFTMQFPRVHLPLIHKK